MSFFLLSAQLHTEDVHRYQISRKKQKRNPEAHHVGKHIPRKEIEATMVRDGSFIFIVKILNLAQIKKTLYRFKSRSIIC